MTPRGGLPIRDDNELIELSVHGSPGEETPNSAQRHEGGSRSNSEGGVAVIVILRTSDD